MPPDSPPRTSAEAALSALARRLMDGERRTTQRLASALHDQLGQTLTALRLTLDLSSPSPDARAQARDLVDQALRELRLVLGDLSPPLLDGDGLAAALDNELAECRSLHPGVRLRLQADDAVQDQRWPVPVEYAVFMIAREALDNALRHGSPSSVQLRLRGDAGGLALEVEDDGVGLPAEAAQPHPAHLGLVGMRERAGAIGATLALSALEGGGTRLALRWSAPA